MICTEEIVGRGTKRERATPACPRCQSSDVEAVAPLMNASLRDAVEAACSLHASGPRSQVPRLLTRWACIATANALRDRWSCGYCRSSFR